MEGLKCAENANQYGMKMFSAETSKKMASLITSMKNVEDDTNLKKKRLATLENEIKRMLQEKNEIKRGTEDNAKKLQGLAEKKCELEITINTEMKKFKTRDTEIKEDMEKIKTSISYINDAPHEAQAVSDPHIRMVDFLMQSISLKEADLQCPVCLETASSPIYSCPDVICSSCRPKVKQCPVCRVRYQGQPQRHRFAEKTLEDLVRLQNELAEVAGPAPATTQASAATSSMKGFSVTHAMLAKDQTLETLNIAKCIVNASKSNTSIVINRIFQLVKKRVIEWKTQGLWEVSDPRLDSFLHYLVANDVTVHLYRRALTEQVSLDECFQQGDLGKEVARTARDNMRTSVGTPEDVSEEISEWHKTYHQFRTAVHYFVLGVEKYSTKEYGQAMELLTASFRINKWVGEELPEVASPVNKMMMLPGLMGYFHLTMTAFTTRLVDQFVAGGEPAQVVEEVLGVLMPAVRILQSRIVKEPASADLPVLEEVRSLWCSLTEYPHPPMGDLKRSDWGTIFNAIMSDNIYESMEQRPGCRYPLLADDMKISEGYENAVHGLIHGL